jgi:hypothetical protein
MLVMLWHAVVLADVMVEGSSSLVHRCHHAASVGSEALLDGWTLPHRREEEPVGLFV